MELTPEAYQRVKHEVLMQLKRLPGNFPIPIVGMAGTLPASVVINFIEIDGSLGVDYVEIYAETGRITG